MLESSDKKFGETLGTKKLLKGSKWTSTMLRSPNLNIDEAQMLGNSIKSNFSNIEDPLNTELPKKSETQKAGEQEELPTKVHQIQKEMTYNTELSREEAMMQLQRVSDKSKSTWWNQG